MPLSTPEVRQLVARLADRHSGRTEANVQSDLHMLLAAAPLDLGEDKLQDIILESPAGQRRRIDVETGFTVFEVKRDLRPGRVREDAVTQLTGYVAARAQAMQQRYVGVLTDGAEWHLYNLSGETLILVSSLEIDPRSPDVDGLLLWLEGVLATTGKIKPTPREITARLGANSPAHALDISDLTTLYRAHQNLPTVRLKRELWAKLLTTALGTAFSDDERLFIEHTLLVTTAEIIAHAVVGIDPADPSVSPAILVRGGLFTQAQITGVVDHDFFDWVAEVPGGQQWVRTLARRLARFAWGQVEHDVMKVLYESVISADERHRLGEYYTPDWLAEEIVSKVVHDPLTTRVLDPGCGSGTFLFHAVRHYLTAAEAAQTANADAVLGVTSHVTGVDVHPVAVTFARVTYLLAIGMGRLQAADRPPIAIPVYLGDSVQWGHGETLMHAEGLSIPTDEGSRLWADDLRFPERLLDDAGRFDQLVSELADRAADRAPGAPVPSLGAVFRRYAVYPDDQAVISETFEVLCRLHDEGRNHIWGYYVRNLARPLWLAQPANRVDALIGNPPWLAYRYMPAAMQASFRELSDSRNLWAGSTVATHQDLSGLFVVRCIELYLRDGGRLGFVMPLAALSRRQFAGFRAGRYRVNVAFGQPWDLHAVKPSFFPVPASVVFGQRAAASVPLASPPEVWSGRLPVANASKAVAAEYITRADAAAAPAAAALSPYAPRFAQGASVVPRVLFMVEAGQASALGTGAGRKSVRSQRSATEKRPWRQLPALTGIVETAFIRSLYLGDNVLPFRLLPPRHAVIPWDGKMLLNGDDERIDDYPGMADWWRHAEEIWNAHRSSDRLTLLGQLDYRRKLSQQFPLAAHRVVYSKGGMYLAAARMSDPTAIIDHKLYWAAVSGLSEARYLTAILNSDVLTQLVRPLQARGEHNPRDFDKYIFRLPIPLYDSSADEHQQLVDLAEQAETAAAAVELPPGVSFQAQRRRIREALASDGVAAAIDRIVAAILEPTETGQ
jgi:SAM-dependent methyltransferase